MVSRRIFVSDCCTAVAALAAAPGWLSLPSAQAARFQGPLNYAAFAAQLHTVFRVRLASGRVVDLRLTQARLAPPPRVVPGCRPPLDADNERFSLIFCGPQDAPLPSAIHAFEHAQLGCFDLHLGEVGLRDNTQLRYEAVFNQPVGQRLSPRV
jgi:hypothetical protein